MVLEYCQASADVLTYITSLELTKSTISIRFVLKLLFYELDQRFGSDTELAFSGLAQLRTIYTPHMQVVEVKDS